METTELVRYRRALKRKNYSAHTVKTYVNIINHFMRWLTVPLSRGDPQGDRSLRGSSSPEATNTEDDHVPLANDTSLL